MMSRCPTCATELAIDRIGGTKGNPPRRVLLCPRCWTVTDPERLHDLDPIQERRRDLA